MMSLVKALLGLPIHIKIKFSSTVFFAEKCKELLIFFFQYKMSVFSHIFEKKKKNLTT